MGIIKAALVPKIAWDFLLQSSTQHVANNVMVLTNMEGFEGLSMICSAHPCTNLLEGPIVFLLCKCSDIILYM